MRIRSGKDRPPHVVMFVENLPVPLDRRVWLEALALTESGFRVTIVSPRGRGGMRRVREIRDGIAILRYPQHPAAGLRGYVLEYLPSMTASLVWLLVLRLRGPVDVIHGANPPDLFWILGRIGKLWGARFVFDQHDANPELARAKWGHSRLGAVLVRVTTALERRSYLTADLVIATNDSYAELARTRGRVDPMRVVVVRNAPPRGAFKGIAGTGNAGTPARSPDVAAPRRRNPPFRLGYLGVMGSQDGVDLLIDAIAWLAEHRADLDVHADLVGDGEARPALEARVRAAGIEDRVRFHGYQSSDVFVRILTAADLCVSPDPPTPFNNISTMTKVVEYLAMGRPVVTFDLAETGRVLGAAGAIAPSDDAESLATTIGTVADDRDRLESMARTAQGRLEELNLAWETSAARLVAAYRRLIPDRS
jgi:glycosyltransferase involved in cell wall biosynthesis